MTMPAANGHATRPRPARPDPAKAAETYHGIPVLRLRVGDPVPCPPTPEWYVVDVHPDLARHLLSLNHPDNRRLRQRTVAKYAGDMRDGHWPLTSEAITFGRSGRLLSGQHRLMAVTEYGGPVHMLISVGWPDDVINVIDRGIGRTNADALRITGLPNGALAAAAVARVIHYVATVGTRRSWKGMPAPSAQAVLGALDADPEGWAVAVRQGNRAYKRLDLAFTAPTWAAAHHIIAATSDPGLADAFFDEVIEGTGAPRSSTRTLADWARRRPVTQTRSGDVREPIELIVRAFNAWRAGKALQAVAQPGFELSRIRP